MAKLRLQMELSFQILVSQLFRIFNIHHCKFFLEISGFSVRSVSSFGVFSF